jgi:phospholipase D1/2
VVKEELQSPLRDRRGRTSEASSPAGADAKRPRKRKGSFLLLASMLLVPMLVAILWRTFGADAWPTPERMAEFGTRLGHVWWGPPTVVAAYFVAVLTVFPTSVMIVATAMAFGPVIGGLFAFCGLMLAALVLFALGRWIAHRRASQVVQSALAESALADSRLVHWARRLHLRGVTLVFLLRLLPVAPTIVVNLFCGAGGIRFRDYVWGTALGILPGTIYYSIFGRSIARWTRDPDLTTALVLVALAGIGVGFGLLSRSKRTAPRAPGGEPAVPELRDI